MKIEQNVRKLISKVIMDFMQIGYLLLNNVLFSKLSTLYRGLGEDFGIIEYITMPIPTIISIMKPAPEIYHDLHIYVSPIEALAWILLAFYPIISVSSFSIFIWADVTGNLHKREMYFYICNLPLFLILIILCNVK